MTHVLVAVPANNEADEIGGCLLSVIAAATVALDSGACTAVTIGVALNRCTDTSADVAAAALRGWPDHIVMLDTTSRTVGGVRAGLIDALAAQSADTPSNTWVFNTDADSRVPRDWITHTLAQAQAHGAVVVAGMVELRHWEASDQARDDYRLLIAAGIHGSTHTHVYGANLAVRFDAYRRVGGFAAVHAEDQDLVDRVRAAGERVLTVLTPSVRTSTREPGRAHGGLGTLLETIRTARESTPIPEQIRDPHRG